MKQKIRIFAFIFLLCMQAGLVLAQTGKQDVLYLKNGNILRGNIVEMIPEKTIKIELIGNNLLVIPMSEVERISKEGLPLAVTRNPANILQPSTFYSLISPSLLYGEDASRRVQLNGSFQVVNGYRFNRFVSAGLGMGIEALSGYRLLPLFLESRGFLLNKPSTPFYFAGAGYSFNYQSPFSYHSEIKGGLMAQAGIGFRTPVGKTSSFFTGIGYRYQYTYVKNNYSYLWQGTENIVEIHNHFNRVMVNFGFMF